MNASNVGPTFGYAMDKTLYGDAKSYTWITKKTLSELSASVPRDLNSHSFGLAYFVLTRHFGSLFPKRHKAVVDDFLINYSRTGERFARDIIQRARTYESIPYWYPPQEAGPALANLFCVTADVMSLSVSLALSIYISQAAEATFRLTSHLYSKTLQGEMTPERAEQICSDFFSQPRRGCGAAAVNAILTWARSHP